VPKTVYSPGDEPYLGRETVLAFDKLIVACHETNAKIAPLTHKVVKSDLQWAACQLIPQGINIALSIRKLVRRGYLFGAHVLMRPLAERTTILLYLHRNPAKVQLWKRGWKYGERPSFAKMLKSIAGDHFPGVEREITQLLNSLTHGDPDSAVWSLVQMDAGGVGHGVSKIVDNPALCDKVCLDAATWLAVLLGMMSAIFPEAGDQQTANGYSVSD
jgi:hypothetical protein